MKVLSLFSGVGGFDLGLERAGMQTVFQCEWDKHATKILQRHWPDVPRWDDVSTLTGAHILQHAPVIDVVAWGSPCQDLSVAGKRAGLDGARSGLFHQGIRIIKELRELTNGKCPRISIWENVAGALSSAGGADFGQVLYEMDEAGACFSEWRLLDAQYFGVPQRRRRVFVVSVFDSGTAARCPDPLLPVSESLRGDLETGKQAGQEPAREVAGCLRSGGAGGVPSSRGEHLVISEGVRGDSLTGKPLREEPAREVANCLRVGSGVGERGDGTDNLITETIGALCARNYKGVGSQYVDEGKVIVETFTKGKRAQTVADDETWDEGRPAPTLNAFDQGDTRATTVIVGSLQARDYKGANHEGARDGKLITEPMLLDGRRVDDVRVYDPPVQTLQARMGTGGNNVPMLAFDTQFGSNANVTEEAAPTLRTEGNGMAVAIPTQQAVNEVAGFLRSGGDGGVPSSRGEHLVVENREPVMLNFQGSKGNSITSENGVSFTLNAMHGHDVHVVAPSLTASNDPSRSPQSAEVTQQVTAVHQATMAVRRLTPVECERLMGWPDGWTDGQADTHRYKQCGNGVASPVAEWIGKQLIHL
jgi:site-specific DNA-cytosine methylase